MTSPAQMTPSEKQQMRQLAGIADRSRGDRWLVEEDDAGAHLISLRAGGGSAILCTFHSQATADERELIATALPSLFLFLTSRQRAVAALEALRAQLPKEPDLRPGDFAANAAMLCNEPSFQRFLERKDVQANGPIYNKEMADAALKRILKIDSKSQFNREAEAQAAFLELRAEYEAWKAGA